jgi:hypothetical protein
MEKMPDPRVSDGKSIHIGGILHTILSTASERLKSSYAQGYPHYPQANIHKTGVL